MTSSTKTFTVCVEDNQGYEHEVEVTLTARFSYDSHYGADADGNRGIGVWELEDYDIDEIDGKSLKEHTIQFVALVDGAINEKINDIDFDLNQ
jgi:hypothetical protein